MSSLLHEQPAVQPRVEIAGATSAAVAGHRAAEVAGEQAQRREVRLVGEYLGECVLLGDVLAVVLRRDSIAWLLGLVVPAPTA